MQELYGFRAEGKYNLYGLYEVYGQGMVFANEVEKQGRYIPYREAKAKAALFVEVEFAADDLCRKKILEAILCADHEAIPTINQRYVQFVKQQFDPLNCEKFDPNAPEDKEIYELSREKIVALISKKWVSATCCDSQ